jgi:hypothetical protein
MAVVSIKNKLRRGNLLVGNEAYDPAGFDSIATVTIGAGGASNVEFTSIPSTYTHLQLRCFGHLSGSGNVGDVIRMTFNSDTGSNYAYHLLAGSGSSVSASSASSNAWIYSGVYIDSFGYSQAFGVSVIDILDYANTNKYKTTRTLFGYDFNSGDYSRIALGSGLWQSTNAITSIKLVSGLALNVTQYSHFALYGIKSA